MNIRNWKVCKCCCVGCHTRFTNSTYEFERRWKILMFHSEKKSSLIKPGLLMSSVINKHLNKARFAYYIFQIWFQLWWKFKPKIKSKQKFWKPLLYYNLSYKTLKNAHSVTTSETANQPVKNTGFIFYLTHTQAFWSSQAFWSFCQNHLFLLFFYGFHFFGATSLCHTCFSH